MLEWTNRHCRFFLRQISRHTVLYTEMVPAAGLVRGEPTRWLRFDGEEHPVCLQLGGSDPDLLAKASVLTRNAGFDEVNLNLGCPSPRVACGRFGASLMASPAIVADGIKAMRDAVDIPVTAKIRLGVDELDNDQYLAEFVATLQQAGCDAVIVHARKAWLSGLSPKENREIPPLQYERVWRIKSRFARLPIILNGGIRDLDQAARQLDKVDGVMIGRAAYHDPFCLAHADHLIYGQKTPYRNRESVAAGMLDYIERELGSGSRLHHITRHMLGLFHGQPGARAWRRTLGAGSRLPCAGPEVVVAALRAVARARQCRAGSAALSA